VVVTTLNPGYPAQKAELRPGDVVRAINGAPVTDLDEFMKLYDASREKKEAKVLLEIQQGRGHPHVGPEGDLLTRETRGTDWSRVAACVRYDAGADGAGLELRRYVPACGRDVCVASGRAGLCGGAIPAPQLQSSIETLPRGGSMPPPETE
jgi:hypothetical protein